MTAVVNAVDISEFQSLSDDDWRAMKNAGIQAVIIRATSSLRLDKLVKIHIAAAKKFGFNWHLYHDWEGQTGEADYAIKSAEELGLTSNQVLFFDMEGNHSGNWSDVFEKFRKKSSDHFQVGLYISESPYQERFNDNQLQAEHVIRWIANYSKEPKNYDIWQKSGHGSGGFGNYTGDIDRDVDPNGILKVVADDPVKDYQPTAEDIMIRQIILQPGYDSETGVYGFGCSYDNGRTFRVYWTIYGQKYYQEDVDRIWPFLKDRITTALSVDWDNVQNKPKFVTPDELEARLDKLSMPTIKWADIKDKPVIPSVAGLAKESELSNYAKLSDIPKLPDLSGYALKSELPSLKGYAKLTDIPSVTNLASQSDLNNVKATADSAESKAEQAQSTADANTKTLADKVSRSELNQYATKEELNNVKPNTKVPQIDSGDFNELTDNLTYEIVSSSEYRNAPVNKQSGILVVRGGSNLLIQIFYAANDYVYHRMRENNSWHEWKWSNDWN